MSYEEQVLIEFKANDQVTPVLEGVEAHLKQLSKYDGFGNLKNLGVDDIIKNTKEFRKEIDLINKQDLDFVDKEAHNELQMILKDIKEVQKAYNDAHRALLAYSRDLDKPSSKSSQKIAREQIQAEFSKNAGEYFPRVGMDFEGEVYKAIKQRLSKISDKYVKELSSNSILDREVNNYAEQVSQTFDKVTEDVAKEKTEQVKKTSKKSTKTSKKSALDNVDKTIEKSVDNSSEKTNLGDLFKEAKSKQPLKETDEEIKNATDGLAEKRQKKKESDEERRENSEWYQKFKKENDERLARQAKERKEGKAKASAPEAKVETTKKDPLEKAEERYFKGATSKISPKRKLYQEYVKNLDTPINLAKQAEEHLNNLLEREQPNGKKLTKDQAISKTIEKFSNKKLFLEGIIDEMGYVINDKHTTPKGDLDPKLKRDAEDYFDKILRPEKYHTKRWQERGVRDFHKGTEGFIQDTPVTEEHLKKLEKANQRAAKRNYKFNKELTKKSGYDIVSEASDSQLAQMDKNRVDADLLPILAEEHLKNKSGSSEDMREWMSSYLKRVVSSPDSKLGDKDRNVKDYAQRQAIIDGKLNAFGEPVALDKTRDEVLKGYISEFSKLWDTVLEEERKKQSNKAQKDLDLDTQQKDVDEREQKRWVDKKVKKHKNKEKAEKVRDDENVTHLTDFEDQEGAHKVERIPGKVKGGNKDRKKGNTDDLDLKKYQKRANDAARKGDEKAFTSALRGIDKLGKHDEYDILLEKHAEKLGLDTTERYSSRASKFLKKGDLRRAEKYAKLGEGDRTDQSGKVLTKLKETYKMPEEESERDAFFDDYEKRQRERKQARKEKEKAEKEQAEADKKARIAENKKRKAEAEAKEKEAEESEKSARKTPTKFIDDSYLTDIKKSKKGLDEKYVENLKSSEDELRKIFDYGEKNRGKLGRKDDENFQKAKNYFHHNFSGDPVDVASMGLSPQVSAEYQAFLDGFLNIKNKSLVPGKSKKDILSSYIVDGKFDPLSGWVALSEAVGRTSAPPTKQESKTEVVEEEEEPTSKKKSSKKSKKKKETVEDEEEPAPKRKSSKKSKGLSDCPNICEKLKQPLDCFVKALTQAADALNSFKENVAKVAKDSSKKEEQPPKQAPPKESPQTNATDSAQNIEQKGKAFDNVASKANNANNATKSFIDLVNVVDKREEIFKLGGQSSKEGLPAYYNYQRLLSILPGVEVNARNIASLIRILDQNTQSAGKSAEQSYFSYKKLLGQKANARDIYNYKHEFEFLTTEINDASSAMKRFNDLLGSGNSRMVGAMGKSFGTITQDVENSYYAYKKNLGANANARDVYNYKQFQMGFEAAPTGPLSLRSIDSISRLNSDFTNMSRSVMQFTGSLQGVNNQFARLLSIVGSGKIITDSLSAAALRETNEIMLTARRGNEEATKMYDKIQQLVVKLPGNDSFMNQILTMIGTMDESITSKDLDIIGNTISDYYMAAQAKGQLNNETEREIRNYLLTGETRSLNNSVIASEIKSLKNLSTITERANAMQKAMQKTGLDSIAHYDSYANTLEKFKGHFQKAFADIGDVIIGFAKGLMDVINVINDLTDSKLSVVMLSVAGTIMGIVGGIAMFGNFLNLFQSGLVAITTQTEVWGRSLQLVDMINRGVITTEMVSNAVAQEGAIVQMGKNKAMVVNKTMLEAMNDAEKESIILSAEEAKQNSALIILNFLEADAEGKKQMIKESVIFTTFRNIKAIIIESAHKLYNAGVTLLSGDAEAREDIIKNSLILTTLRNAKVRAIETLQKIRNTLATLSLSDAEASLNALQQTAIYVTLVRIKQLLIEGAHKVKNAIATFLLGDAELTENTIKSDGIAITLIDNNVRREGIFLKIKNILLNFKESLATAENVFYKGLEAIANKVGVDSEISLTIAKEQNVFAQVKQTLILLKNIALKIWESIVNKVHAFTEIFDAGAQDLSTFARIKKIIVTVALTVAEWGLIGATAVLDALMSPMVITILLIVGAVILLIKALEWLGQAFGWWKDINGMFQAMWAGINRIWKAFMNSEPIKAIVKTFQDLTYVLRVLFNTIGKFVGGIWTLLFGTGDGKKKGFDIVGVFLEIVGAIGKFLWYISPLKFILDIFNAIGKGIAWVLDQWNKFVQSETFQTIIKIFQDLRKEFGQIWTELNNAFAEVAVAWNDLWSSGDSKKKKEEFNWLAEILKAIAWILTSVIVPVIKGIILLVRILVTPLKIVLGVATAVINAIKWVIDGIMWITGNGDKTNNPNPNSNPNNYKPVKNPNSNGAKPYNYAQSSGLAKKYSPTTNNHSTIINNNFSEGSVQPDARNMTKKDVQKMFTSAFGYNKTKGTKGVLRQT